MSQPYKEKSQAMLEGLVSAIFAVVIWLLNWKLVSATFDDGFHPLYITLILIVLCPPLVALPTVISRYPRSKNYFLYFFGTSTVAILIFVIIFFAWNLAFNNPV
jgi:hypothetical protein